MLRLTGLGIGTMIQPLHADRRFIEVVDEDVRRWGLSTGGKLRKEVSCLVVMPEDVMKLESPEPLFEMMDLFAVCHHLGSRGVDCFMTWSTTSSESPRTEASNPEVGSDPQSVDQSFVLGDVVGRIEMQAKRITKMVSLGGDQNDSSPRASRLERAVKVHCLVFYHLRGWHSLSLRPFGVEVSEHLGFDRHSGRVKDVKSHELEGPFGDSAGSFPAVNDLAERG